MLRQYLYIIMTFPYTAEKKNVFVLNIAHKKYELDSLNADDE